MAKLSECANHNRPGRVRVGRVSGSDGAESSRSHGGETGRNHAEGRGSVGLIPSGSVSVDDARPGEKDEVWGTDRRSDRVIAFIEKLTIPSGIGAGGPFILRDWQRDFIRDIYDPCDADGYRLVRNAILSVGRKNGKTALIAALVLCHLVGPEAEANGEIYSAANEREQAAIVYKMAAQFVRADEDLSELLRPVDSTKTIACYHNGSTYKALSAEAGSKHGLNPSLLIYDELAQAKTRELYDVLDTSQGARREPLFITISTQNPDPEHVLSLLIDDGLRDEDPTTVTHLYCVPDDEPDIFNEDVWHAANPALGDFLSIEYMRAKARKAQRMPSYETAFRNLHLNQRIDAISPLIPKSEWMACQDLDLQIDTSEPIYLGLDLSSTADLTALVAITAGKEDKVSAWFWKPGDSVREHSERDGAPYLQWVNDGWIEAPQGRSIQYEFVAERIASICAGYTVLGLAFDRWRMDYLIPHLVNAGLEPRRDGDGGGLRMVPWGQGWKDMAPAIDALENAILERTFKHPGNPVLTYCFANAQAVTDPAGNRKLDKSKTKFRIDGAVACAQAIGLKNRDMQEAEVLPQIINL